MEFLNKNNNYNVSIIIKRNNRNKGDESLEPGTGMCGLYQQVINDQYPPPPLAGCKWPVPKDNFKTCHAA